MRSFVAFAVSVLVGCEHDCLDPPHDLHVAGVPLNCETGSTTGPGSSTCSLSDLELDCGATARCDLDDSSDLMGACYPVGFTFAPACAVATIQVYDKGQLVFAQGLSSGTTLGLPLDEPLEIKSWVGSFYSGGWATFVCEAPSPNAGAGNR
ncbi:MAG TPA: hypothetical protein VMI54_20815 [Polyangiaceae bacterium]|nr:hypothetical protein [Polyangiaceae bacterium]